MEQSEGSSEQAECSKEQNELSEQTEIPSEQRASEQTDRAETTPVDHAECSSEQPECSNEIPGSSKQTECSIEQTAPAAPAKDAEPLVEWSEPWLELFAKQLLCLPQLWRTTHAANCKPKSGRGFAYLRLMSAMRQTEGEVRERLARAIALCKEFFRLLRQKMRAAALECLEAGPEEALRRCPEWVRWADSYLDIMPYLFTTLTVQRNEKRVAKKRIEKSVTKKVSSIQSETRAVALESLDANPEEALRRCVADFYLNNMPYMQRNEKHDAKKRVAAPLPAPLTDLAGVRLMRRVVRGMRRAARQHGGPTRAAAAAVAARLGDTEERVFALWCGMRKLSVFKLRSLLLKGDAPSESGRLDALDWAIVDLLIMYAGITLVEEASYQNYEQLSALLGTFHLVQRFGLERPGPTVLPSHWSEAARWYSRNRVQMSAVGLQKRWLELKMDTRCRMLSRLRQGVRAPDPLPLHQAIARRYEHVVVTKKDPPLWKWLVYEDRVALPTSERGPAPGEPYAPRLEGADQSLDSDTASAGGDADSDDDLTIVEKTLETIDLSEDQNDETDANEVVKEPSDTPVPESQVARSLPSLEAEPSENTNVSRQFDKTIDVNKEIVDLDAPSPKSYVLEAFQGLDAGNIQTTVLFESDEEDATSIDVRSADDRASVNKNNESHDKDSRRESMDSEDGNLVIDCEDSNSAIDVRNVNHNTVWKEIEREMIPEPFNNRAGCSGYNQNDTIVVLTQKSTKDNIGDESIEKYPLLSRMLQTKSVYDTFTAVRPKVYYNTKRYRVGKAQKQYANAKVSVGRKDIKAGPDRAQVAVSELVSAARMAKCAVELMSEVGGEADGGQGETGEQQDGMGTIDPKLLMYAVVVLRRIEDEIPQILSLQSTRPRTPLSPRVDDAPELWSRQSTPPPLDEEILSEQSTPPSQNLLCPRESPPPSPLSPPNATIPPPHSHSLFHYYAAAVRPKFVFLKRNIPLLKQCKPCSVVLRRVDLGDRAERVAMNRVAKKVELPDIEEVRRNNRSMLTAQVAPLAPRREGEVSSPEPPSCSSDSDWTPDAERPRPAEPHPALPDLAEPHLAEPHSAEPHSAESADEEAGATSAELGQLLNDLLAEAGSNGDCNHENNTGVRGPLASIAESCASCALRVLSAPPVSGAEARLQRRLLRRLAKPPNQPTSTTVTTTGANPTIPTISVVTERKEKSKKSKSKLAGQKRRRPPSPPPRPPPPPPPRPRSPQDPEAAAREWLRQKNIAAEKFGVKPRSYKKAAPAVQAPEPPAILKPLATTTQVPQLEPPPVLKAMQATNEVPKPAQNQPLPRLDTIKVVMRESIASPIPPADRHSGQPFKITCGPLNKSAQSSNSTLLNQGNNSTPLLNQTNPVFNKNSAQTSKKAPQILNHTARILNDVNAPSIFNPNAIADINKKLVTLAPTTETEAFGFHPVISNVHSLATSNTPTFKKLDPNAKKDPKTQQNFVIIPASNPTGATSILLRSQESEVAKPSENVFTSPQTLPQVVNVTSGVHLLSPNVVQALHLIVSQSPHITNASMLSNVLNQSNMVLSGNMLQNVQKPQGTPLTAVPNYIVTSMPQVGQSQPLIVPQRPQIANAPMLSNVNQSNMVMSGNMIQNIQKPQGMPLPAVPNYIVTSMPQVGQSQPLIVPQSPQIANAPMLSNVLNQSNMVLSGNMIQNVQKPQEGVQPAVPNYVVTSMPQLVQSQPLLVSCTSQATPTSASQPRVFSSLPGRTSDTVPMIVRSVQAGPAAVSQQNVVSQENSVSQGDVVSQQNVTSQRNVSQLNPVLQQHALSKQNVAQHNAILQQNVLQRHVVTQQYVSHQNPVSQQIPTQANLEHGPKVAEGSDNANKDSDPPPLTQTRPCLDWDAPPIPSHEWARGQDSTTLTVLCTGPRERAGWELSEFLLVSEEELPASRPAYWTTRPRARLSLPGEEPPSPAKRRKVEPDTPKTWLKVKAFARLAPEEVQDAQKEPQDSQKETQGSQKETQGSQKETQGSQKEMTAPARVFVSNTVYQKLSDDPLVYAKVLVAVRDARACRALLARGAALQLYCLRTGLLFPLQAEPKEDVSRITLSGDEEVSGALVSLATQLYKLPDSSDPHTETPAADPDRQEPKTEIKNPVDEAADRPEAAGSAPRPSKRRSGAGAAERGVAPKPPPCQPADVIELSDED